MSRTYSSTPAHTHTGVISIPVISSQTCVLGFAWTPPSCCKPYPQTPDLHSQALGDDARDVVGHAASRDVHDTLEADLKGGGERGGGAR